MQRMFTLYPPEQANPDEGTELLRVRWPRPPGPATLGGSYVTRRASKSKRVCFGSHSQGFVRTPDPALGLPSLLSPASTWKEACGGVCWAPPSRLRPGPGVKESWSLWRRSVCAES